MNPGEAAEFVQLLRRFSAERLRDGAWRWEVFEDVAECGRFLETFVLPSWLEHQRQHHRVSRADADLQRRVTAFHRAAESPIVRHFIAPSYAEPSANGSARSGGAVG